MQLNRICSDNVFFDQRCNELEHWLHERKYSERVLRQEILKAQKMPRNELLEKEHNHQEKNKLKFTYYPALQNTKTILKELQTLLPPENEHQKLFLNCQFIVNTDTFSLIATDKTFKIHKGPLSCNSKKVVHLSECNKCKNPCVGKAQAKFCMRLNNYQSAQKFFKTKKGGTQKLFHRHCIQDDHEGKNDWQFTINDHCTTNAELRKREVY